MDGGKALAIGGVILAVLVFNFIPAIIAHGRNHPEKRLIGRLNILSLFSFVLWMALVAWAVGGARNDSVINKFVGNAENRGRLVAIVVALVSVGIATTAWAMTRG